MPHTSTRQASAPAKKPRFLAPHQAVARSALLLSGVAASLQVGAQEAQPVAQPQTVEVIGTTPLPGIGTPLNQVPGNIQTIKSGDLNSRRALNVSDALDRSGGSFNINDTAGNPFQHDVNFRGFTASPALGTPQGLSVFVDGVRVNEVFGDTVNWDLIPSAAISSILVIPGSNPVFGLNTLGGAINVSTKSGLKNAGTSIQAYGGSFGRHAVEFESGGHGENVDYFVSGNSTRDSGWGEHNPSRAEQVFAKTGVHGERTDVSVSLTLADTRLEGNQTLPLSFLDDFRQAYSWPDFQKNRLAFLHVKADHRISDDLLVEASAYYRRLETSVLNSNVNNNFDTTQAPGPGNQPTGNSINQINQHRPGFSLQLTSLAHLSGHQNHLVAGASYDGGRTDFTQSSQEAGSSRDTSSTSPVSLDTSLHAKSAASGLFVSDNFGIDDKTFLTLSGRYNHATVKLEDQLGTALNGEHSFLRLDPAVGIAYNPTNSVTTYASYNEGMRVPTPVELTCADPNAPCSLPNAFSSDPALKPVISKTVEVGGRGRIGSSIGWSAALFRSVLNDDIQFISSGGGATSAGYFQNVGQTRRQGLELGLDAKSDRLTTSAHYSYIDATFQSPLILNSPSNSTAGALSCATCSDIQIQPGNRIPGIPHHILKLGAEYAFCTSASVGANLLAQSSQYARGDENNQDVHGPVPGFAVVNLDARYRFATGWELFAKVNNLLDRRYSTFGTLGQNVFTGPGNTFDSSGATWREEQFRSVGAPRGAWIGLSYAFGGRAP